MTTKTQKLVMRLNEEFRGKFAEAMREKFALESDLNIFSMKLIVTRADGEDFTHEQHSWLGAYSHGYSDAMGVVQEWLMTEKVTVGDEESQK